MSNDRTEDDGRIATRLDDGIFHIVFDRPRKLNGFTPSMLRELALAYTAYEQEPAARCALVSAEGAHFTAGLDLPKVAPMFASGTPMAPPGTIDPFGLAPPWRTKPVVFAVQGICFTLGIELMLAADCVVAAGDCRFAQLEAKRGIMASGGATIRMVQRAGWGNAMKLLLTGQEFDAATALRFGFVTEVVEPGRQLARAESLAREIAGAAPLAVQAMITNARAALHQGFAAASAELVPLQARLSASADAAEGVRSFAEKRTARFTGS